MTHTANITIIKKDGDINDITSFSWFEPWYPYEVLYTKEGYGTADYFAYGNTEAEALSNLVKKLENKSILK